VKEKANHEFFIIFFEAMLRQDSLICSCDCRGCVQGSSGHRLIWWGGCDIDLQWTQCFTGPYCVNQSLSHTCIYEETSLRLV